MNEEASASTPSTDISGLISHLISSPDSISKISKIIEEHTSKENRDISPPSNNFDQESADDSNYLSHSSDNKEVDSPTFSNSGSFVDKPNPLGIFSFLSSKKLDSLTLKDEQATLLLAIRPYLSEHRQELIDSFINLSKIAKIFTKLS